MSHQIVSYETCIGCTQCVRACPTDTLEIVIWKKNAKRSVVSAVRLEDCIGCKRCESSCPTDFVRIRVFLKNETKRSLGLTY